MPANAKLWSPDSPFLYNMEVTLYKDGKAIDQVKSYTAMRKYSIRKGQNGITRLQLNNKDYFQFGPLDQGWWPDGLYTAPTDEALVYDLKKTKDFGYNMVRQSRTCTLVHSLRPIRIDRMARYAERWS